MPFIPLLIVGGIVYSAFRVYKKSKKAKPASVRAVVKKSKKSQKPSSVSPVISMEKEIDKYVVVSGVSLGLSIIGGLFYPPVSLACIPLLIYTCIPFFKDGYKAIVEEKRVRMSVVLSIILPGYIVTRCYFSGSFSLFLCFYGLKLLNKTEDHTRQSLISIFGEHPSSVWILRNGVEVEIPFEDLQNHHVVVVRAGETIPADGLISDGMAVVDQHILTGESQPVEKEVGDKVFALTIVLSGRICVRVEKSGRETAAAQIGEILLKTADFKTAIQSRGEKIADASALPSLLLSAAAFPFIGGSGSLAVLNSNMANIMRITAPITTLNYMNIASDSGILVKDGRSLDLLSKVDTVVFDKTGTLTLEQPIVGKIHTLGEISENDLLKYAAAAEYKQKHPIAKAILNEARKRSVQLPEIDNAEYQIGYGIKVKMSEHIIRVGSVRFMETEGISIHHEIREAMQNAHKYGHSSVMIAIDEYLGGAIELHAAIRPEAEGIIRELHKSGISVYIISGDHEQPTKNLAKKLGIDKYFAEILPEDKANLIERFQKEGKSVCFVGDGINDSIALKKANVSVSLRGASTIATDTAQIVLMDESLRQLGHLFRIAKELDKNLKRGFMTTIIPGIVCLGGVFFLHFGLLSSIILFNTSLVLGVSNSMLPVINSKFSKKIRSV